jgi:pilus assembly protein Flp/PilA
MLNHIKRFIKNESGGTAIEYGLIASGVAVAIIPSVDKVGQKAGPGVHQHPERSALIRSR